jgi:myo-inositol catabolism protein IolS
MKYTNLGPTKIKISKIGMGTLFKKCKIDFNKKIKHIIDKSYHLGINFIDTAPIYAFGNIERTIGYSIKNKRQKIILATKNLPSQNKYNEIISSAEQSLRRLKTDYIDLYQIHWPNHKIEIEESAEALNILLQQGKIRYVGLCNTNLDNLKKYKNILTNKLVAIQNEYNLFERTYEDNLKKFINISNMTMISYSPLSNGKLFNGENERKILNFLEKKYNRTKSEIILNWITSQSKNIIAIPSTLKIKNLVDNANSQKFMLNKLDIDLIKKKCKTKTRFISPDNILIERSESNIFQSLNDAKKNIYKLDPSPEELAEDIKANNLLKPIKLKEIKKNKLNKKYTLKDGNLRYWSWIIAKGKDKKIPSLIWKSI